MGNVESAADLTAGALRQNLSNDNELININLSQLYGNEGDAFAKLYSQYVAMGYLSTRSTWLQKKRKKLQDKMSDNELMLGLDPYNPGARTKQLKFLQRQIHLLCRSADPFKEVLHARCQVLSRVHLAAFRFTKNLELAGQPTILAPSKQLRQNFMTEFLNSEELKSDLGSLLSEEHVKRLQELAGSLPITPYAKKQRAGIAGLWAW